MTNLTFLKALRNKLKGGNLRSIHLNCLPGRFATRLDFANLNYINPELASNFLTQLLTDSCFDFPISFDSIDLTTISKEEQKRLGVLSKRLNTITIENEENYKDHGIKTLGFGYPILIKRSKNDPTKIIKAPLFIWQLDIIKSSNKINTWQILRNKQKNEVGKIIDQEIHSVSLNEVLLSFLKTDENIIIPQINDDLLEDAVIDKNELINECIRVLQSLNGNSNADIKDSLFLKLDSNIENIPESTALDSILNNLSWIHFGGVFGLFRTQKESIITDIDKIIEQFDNFNFDNLLVENINGTSLSAIETDPSQQEILNTLSLYSKKIIQGPPGTGKSQSLTALITNALANNLKCLIVCEKKTALDVIKNNLSKENQSLGELTAVIEDINKDRDPIVNSVRERLNDLGQSINFNPISYANAKDSIETLVIELNKKHKQLDKKIYQGKSWTELVGIFLKKQKKADYQILENKLNYKKFKFHEDESELNILLNKIKEAEKNYTEINTLSHPLEILNDEVIKQENSKGIEIELKNNITALLNNIDNVRLILKEELKDYENWLNNYYDKVEAKIKQLLFEAETKLKEYNSWLSTHYSDYYQLVKQHIEDYQSFVAENENSFGKIFLKNTSWVKLKINILSLLSKKYKSLKHSKVSLINNIATIKKAHYSLKYFEHFYIEESELNDLSIYVENIKTLNNNLDNWYKTTNNTIQSYSSKLCSTYIHPHYANFKEELNKLESSFKSILEEISNDNQIIVSKAKSETILTIIAESNSLLSQFNEIKAIKDYYIKTFSGESIHCNYSSTEKQYNKESIFEKCLTLNGVDKVFKRRIPKVKTHLDIIPEIENIQSDIHVILEHIKSFRTYYNWRKFYISLTTLEQEIIKILVETNFTDWKSMFESWYYYWILSLNEHIDLPKDDDTIEELFESKQELKKTQVQNIINNWKSKQYLSVKNLHSQGINPTGIFNKRGTKGERRNSLRKIVKTNFQLFTDFFPVTLVSPTVCSSILPLEEGIFDIVIFDEASQLRLEDTYPALLRGKIKIVSGDSQQMPPSNFFMGSSTILNPGEDEENLEEQEIDTLQTLHQKNSVAIDLADSESLLAYAENCNYKQSYLKVHYRSQHPDLIEFSNHAFYGKRLIPMPELKEYRSIKFIEVNGIYDEQVNIDEAKKVVDILINQIKPLENGKFPSVGIATLNLYQRNLILEEITKVRQMNPEYDRRIADLGSDLFVKNLENIQGDERDIIIISTTFGRKPDGSFRQNFGPIIQRNGYKLLNVIITRAKHEIYVCTSIPNESISNYSDLLKQFKNNGRAIFYAYLAYAKAVSDRNINTQNSILEQLYENCDSRKFDIEFDVYGSESPFEEEVYYKIAEKFGQERLQQQFKIGGFRIDLVIKSKITGKPIIAIECDGAKYHSSNEAYSWDMFRQQLLEKYGFRFYRIWSTNWFNNENIELQKVYNFIQEVDKEEVSKQIAEPIIIN